MSNHKTFSKFYPFWGQRYNVFKSAILGVLITCSLRRKASSQIVIIRCPPLLLHPWLSWLFWRPLEKKMLGGRSPVSLCILELDRSARNAEQPPELFCSLLPTQLQALWASSLSTIAGFYESYHTLWKTEGIFRHKFLAMMWLVRKSYWWIKWFGVIYWQEIIGNSSVYKWFSWFSHQMRTIKLLKCGIRRNGF